MPLFARTRPSSPAAFDYSFLPALYYFMLFAMSRCLFVDSSLPRQMLFALSYAQMRYEG